MRLFKTKIDDVSPNLPLIKLLQEARVEVVVCGQAVGIRQYRTDEIDPKVSIAFSAATVVINRHAEGYVVIAAP